MIAVNDLSIDKKLILVCMSITGVVVALVFTIISQMSSTDSRKYLVSGLNVVANIVANSSSVSVAVPDVESASMQMLLLKSHPSIVYSCIRTSDNKVFVEYKPYKSSYICDSYNAEKKIYLIGQYVNIYKPIILEGMVVGSLQIKASLNDISNITRKSAKLTMVIFIGLIIPIVILLRKIINHIAEPITRLKDIAKSVTKSKDYSQRIEQTNDDEIGKLVVSFNNMLDQIQASDEELVKEKEKAEVSAIKAKKYAIETEEINGHLESEIKERLRIEHELIDLNETLEKKVNKRTFELKELNEKIGDIARSAEMAEVANGVLHNVGNVLNSVNVSASVIREKVRNSKADNLDRVVKMLENNKSNIADFISKDEAGKKVPKFLSLLSEQLNLEKEDMYGELDELVNNIDHIKNVINMQQSYAGSYGVREKIKLSELVEDALRMSIQGIGIHGIKVLRSFIDIPPLYIDKHKVLQIMINLISNAKHAMVESDNDVNNIMLNISMDEDMALLEISDTGIGIDKDDMSHLFEYGFKKRRDGHGFGLHHSAIVASELGGKISVKSGGLGKGASFMLWLPFDG